MATQNGIPLHEYSLKYGVSVSTLRRRIKSDSIPYRLDEGKYILPDKALEVRKSRSSSQNNKKTTSKPKRESFTTDYLSSPGKVPEWLMKKKQALLNEDLNKEDINDSTEEEVQTLDQITSMSQYNSKEGTSSKRVKLTDSESDYKKDVVQELKKAYAQILQEKEEQLIILKEQVADLQTLVRVLEDQFEKQKHETQRKSQLNSKLNSKLNEKAADRNDPKTQDLTAIETIYQSQKTESLVDSGLDLDFQLEDLSEILDF